MFLNKNKLQKELLSTRNILIKQNLNDLLF